ncbi:hypothetical protein SAMN05216295_109196 [Pseudomonas luteola]|nr:hypothetical protein EGJ50_10180 [Pseudomonas luteola]SHJ23748.1 hypothetical protein SAMN05216295_109196 [Pseudomonas zeshuii]
MIHKHAFINASSLVFAGAQKYPANTAATIRTPDSRDSEMIPQPHNDSFSGTDWSKYRAKALSSLVDYSEAPSTEGALEYS